MSVMSWENLVNLIDIEKKTVVSDFKTNLNYRENKHFNLFSLRIQQIEKNKKFIGIAIGNDDSKVEVMEYYFK